GGELTSGRPDLKEGVYFGAEEPPGAVPLHGPNPGGRLRRPEPGTPARIRHASTDRARPRGSGTPTRPG
ncbi:hypothetical protein AB0I79_54920, partial [Nonomuraea sp. NPDC050202]